MYQAITTTKLSLYSTDCIKLSLHQKLHQNVNNTFTLDFPQKKKKNTDHNKLHNFMKLQMEPVHVMKCWEAESVILLA